MSKKPMPHLEKPEFENKVSMDGFVGLFGVLLTVGLTSLGLLWAGGNRAGAIEAKVEQVEKRQDRTEQRIEKQLEQLNAKFDRLLERRD